MARGFWGRFYSRFVQSLLTLAGVLFTLPSRPPILLLVELQGWFVGLLW